MEGFFLFSDDYGNKFICICFFMCMLWWYFLLKLIVEVEINKMVNVVEI